MTAYFANNWSNNNILEYFQADTTVLAGMLKAA